VIEKYNFIPRNQIDFKALYYGLMRKSQKILWFTIRESDKALMRRIANVVLERIKEERT
jgi:hypothetical protein